MLKVGGFVPVALTEKPEGYDEVFPREGTDKALEGVFYLKREIPQLGLKVAVHPFFKEDVVYLNQGACTPEEAWAAVGRAVYGRLVKAKDGTFTLEPNYTEIGKVAVFSLDRYIEANEPKSAGETRQWLKVAILRNLDAAGWKQLVDASRTPTKITVSTGPLYDACSRMLEALRSELKDRKSALADQIPDRPPIRLVLEKQLHVRLEITLRNGSNLSF